MAKKILVYTNHFYPENFKINEIVEFLDSSNYELKVITGIPNYPSGKIYNDYGFFKKSKEKLFQKTNVIRLPLIPRGSGKKINLLLNYISYFISVLFYTIWLIINNKKYEIVLVHHTSPFFLTLPAVIYSKCFNSFSLLWDLDYWPDTLLALDIIKRGFVFNFFDKICSKIYRNFDLVLVGSSGFLSGAKLRTKKNNVHYFPNWAERVFEKNIVTIPKNKIKFNHGGFNMVFAGNFGDAQDFDNIFKSILITRDNNIFWHFIGDGRYHMKIRHFIESNNLENKVFMYGYHKIDFMPYFFKKADMLFLCLKDKEIFHKTTPAKIQAYMASAKPIAAMISGESNKILKSNKSGIVVKSGDYKKFAKEIIKFSKLSKKLQNDVGINNRLYYDNNYSFEKRKTELLNFLKR